jgi:starch phosphorylase
VFGNRAEEVVDLRNYGYQPRTYYDTNFDLKCAIDRISEGAFSPEEPDRYRDVVNALLGSDHYQLLADFEDYVACQDKVDALYRRPADWTRSAILNVAGMGAFSSDRTIRGYAEDIWGVQPLA